MLMKITTQDEGSRVMGCLRDRVVVEDELDEVDGGREREA